MQFTDAPVSNWYTKSHDCYLTSFQILIFLSYPQVAITLSYLGWAHDTYQAGPAWLYSVKLKDYAEKLAFDALLISSFSILYTYTNPITFNGLEFFTIAITGS